MGVSWNRARYPQITGGILPYKPSSYGGTPMAMETSMASADLARSRRRWQLGRNGSAGEESAPGGCENHHLSSGC